MHKKLLSIARASRTLAAVSIFCLVCAGAWGLISRATSAGGVQDLGGGFPINTSSPVAPVGAIDGVNRMFTLPTAPGPVVLVFYNGTLQQGGGSDYTLSGTTLTFVTAPRPGDIILVVY